MNITGTRVGPDETKSFTLLTAKDEANVARALAQLPPSLRRRLERRSQVRTMLFENELFRR